MSWHVLGDWGTSRLRLFRFEDGCLTMQAEGPGIAKLTTTPEIALRDALAHWRSDGPPESIRLGGMTGAQIGLCETPYVECPASAGTWRNAARRLELQDVPVTIGAGLACMSAGRPDVMRGEEAQIFGAMALHPDLSVGEHVFLLPGTHSKWAWARDGSVQHFRTFMTGELFALLSGQSTLMKTAGEAHPEDEDAGFAAGLARAKEAALAGALFETRAAQLRCARSKGWATGFLSALLIGTEIAEVESSSEFANAPVLVGEPDLTARYGKALADRGHAARILDGTDCALAGLALLDVDD